MTVSTNHSLFEEKGEPKRNQAGALNSAYQPNALPLGHTGSQKVTVSQAGFCGLFLSGNDATGWQNGANPLAAQGDYWGNFGVMPFVKLQKDT